MAMAVILGDPVHRHHLPRRRASTSSRSRAQADRHLPGRAARLRRHDRVLPVPGVHGAAAVPGRQHQLQRVPAPGRGPGRGRLHAAPVRVPRRPARVLDGILDARRRRRLLVIVGGGSTHVLIPLYAVGVFIDFTITQTGMVRHWLSTKDQGWRYRLSINAFGRRADRRRRDRRHVGQVHVGRLARPRPDPDSSSGSCCSSAASTTGRPSELRGPRRPGLRPAASRAAGRDPGQRHQPVGGPGGDVRHVARDRSVAAPGGLRHRRPRGGGALRERWERQLPGVPLVIVESPYRALVGPVVTYLDVLDMAWPPDREAPITIVVLPEYVARHWWDRLLYNQTGQAPEGALVGREHTVIADVPYRRSDRQPRVATRRSARGRSEPAHDRRTQAHQGPEARGPAGPRRTPALAVLPLHGTRPAGRQAGGLPTHDTARGGALARSSRPSFGRPLANEEEIGERLPKKLALPIFSSDAISSSAYATEEILRVLVLAGASALFLSIEVAIAITVLLAVVSFSYRQVCRAYPSGGGAYVVARENLSQTAGLVAAAALFIDYVMTVAVSTASAVSQAYSVWPVLYDIRIEIALASIALITVGQPPRPAGVGQHLRAPDVPVRRHGAADDRPRRRPHRRPARCPRCRTRPT